MNKVSVNRASKLLNELKKEEFEALKAGRNFPEIRAGDSVEIAKLPYISSKEVDIIKGVVIGVTNRANETAIKMLNVRYCLFALKSRINIHGLSSFHCFRLNTAHQFIED